MNEKCFARRRGSECSALARGICHGNYDTCPFYKPKWKADHERRLILKKIAAMPLKRQEEIARKYYQGQEPWAKEDL